MVLDGTWKQARSMLRHLEKRLLAEAPPGILPHVKLSPETLSVRSSRLRAQPACRYGFG
jgi:DTW domain-containing protein YfiP